MNRRHLVLGLSSAAMLAQAGPRPVRAQASGQTLGTAQYMAMTLMAGTLAKQTSELALQRAVDSRVKQFAGFEDAEQTTIAQVLTNTTNPPPVPLDARHQAVLSQLRAASGPAFDQAYVQGQIAGHQELFGIQNAFLQGQPAMNTDTAHVAMMARTTIQMHLTMLRDIETVLRG